MQAASDKAERGRVQDISAERQTTTKALADTQAQLSQARADLAGQQRAVADARAELVRTQQAAEAARAARTDQERQRGDLLDQITRLQAQHDALANERTTLLAALSADEVRGQETTRKLDQARAQLGKVTDTLGKCRADTGPGASPRPLQDDRI